MCNKFKVDEFQDILSYILTIIYVIIIIVIFLVSQTYAR